MLSCVSGDYTLPENRNNITDFIKKAYIAYFEVKQGDQYKFCTTQIICKQCTKHLRQWTKKARINKIFAISFVWLKPYNHVDDCYICALSFVGINRKKQQKLVHLNIAPTISPVPHSNEIPVPIFRILLEINVPSKKEHSASRDNTEDQDYSDEVLHLVFCHVDLNDLICYLNFQRNLLNFCLHNWNRKIL